MDQTNAKRRWGKLRTASSLLALSLSCTTACTGVLTGEGSGSDGNRSAEDPDQIGNADGSETKSRAQGWQPGMAGDAESVTRLDPPVLTTEEYDRTLALVFANQLDPGFSASGSFPAETKGKSGFREVTTISELHVARYYDASEEIAQSLETDLSAVMGCDIKSADDETCLRTFADSVGELLFRRPIEEAEFQTYVSYFREARDTIGLEPEKAALNLLQLWLNSPYFLYRWEDGHKPASVEGPAVKLNGFQIASRLSFFLWRSGPDADLLAAAKAGQLDTPEGVVLKASEMMASPRAHVGIESFIEQWLDLSLTPQLFKDPSRFPYFDDELKAAIAAEVQTFSRNLILTERGTVDQLFATDQVYVNEHSAILYGITGITGTELRPVPLPSDQERAGLLTMPAVLATAADASVPNPFRLGKLLLEKVFCEELDPPPDLPEFHKPESANMISERQYLEELTGIGACNGCHQRLNPLGLGLGDFDAAGAVRTVDEHGFAIDSASVLPTGEQFAGPRELGELVGSSEQVRACVTKQWFRFATGRHEEESEYASLQSAYTQFESTSFTLAELMVALTTTRAFLYRALEDGETVL